MRSPHDLRCSVVRVALTPCAHLAICGAFLISCSGAGGDTSTNPADGDRANLRLDRVTFTQATQDASASIPMVEGAAAVANVQITRSKESVDEVPVVLRLFRGSTLIHTDTARTGGILGPESVGARPNVQFLVASSLVAAGVSWQVEIDPGRTIADSSTTDNVMPRSGVTTLSTVVLPPLRIRFVPIVLTNYGDVPANISLADAESYVSTARQLLPNSSIVVTVGAPLQLSGSFGAAPRGGGPPGFWAVALQAIDAVRLSSTTPDELWYGIVAVPPEFTDVVVGGMAYVPQSPLQNTRAAVSLQPNRFFGLGIVRYVVAHEIGHTLGLSHTPGCGAPEPLDESFPDGGGTLTSTGYDVWSWATGLARGAPSQSGELYDIMSYCSPNWISAHNFAAILRWRLAAAAGPVSRVVREHAIIISGQIDANGAVTLDSPRKATVVLPQEVVSELGRSVLVATRSRDGADTRTMRVRTTRLDHGEGVEHFTVVLPEAEARARPMVSVTARGGRKAVREIR